MYTHVHACSPTRTRAHSYIHVYIHTHTLTCRHTETQRVHICTRAHKHVGMHTHARTQIQACAHTCTHAPLPCLPLLLGVGVGTGRAEMPAEAKVRGTHHLFTTEKLVLHLSLEAHLSHSLSGSPAASGCSHWLPPRAHFSARSCLWPELSLRLLPIAALFFISASATSGP